MNTDNRLVYNRDSVQKSLDLLNESNNEFRDAGVELRNAMDMLNNAKGIDALNRVDNLTKENTPKNLMTMCDENIGNTIYNINSGVERVEYYLANGGDLNINPQPGQGGGPGQQQPTAPSQPTAPNDQFREQQAGPNGEQPPSPPEQPSPPDGPQNGEQQQSGPNGEQPPSPPDQPSPPDGPQNGEQPTTGPNGEQPPSPPDEPKPPTDMPTKPEMQQPSQEDMKKGSLIGALIGLGVGAAATGGTTAAVIHAKKKKENENGEDNVEFQDNSKYLQEL